MVELTILGIMVFNAVVGLFAAYDMARCNWYARRLERLKKDLKRR